MKLPLVFACLAVVAASCAPRASGPLPTSAPARAASDTNPFEGARLYVNPDYASEVERAVPAARSPSEVKRLRRLATYPTAIWLDSIARAGEAARYLDDAQASQANQSNLASEGGAPVLAVFVLYDLPGRDCAAAASAGELAVGQEGERRYRAEFVDRIAGEFRRHPDLRIAAILEPDSLANIVTNLDNPKCAVAEAAYRRSIAYAVRALSMPNVSLYLDAAHAGWIGWDESRARIARIYADVLSLAGGEGRVRGFATNVSNYNSLAGREGARLEPSDPCPDELTYVRELGRSLSAAGVRAGGFVIDTSRNGRAEIRTRWGSWCNVQGAGLGERPRASPAPGIDAYYWVKPPGESDGTSDPAAPRHDDSCRAPDSAPGAPQAGAIFPAYLLQLAALANPPL